MVLLLTYGQVSQPAQPLPAGLDCAVFTVRKGVALSLLHHSSLARRDPLHLGSGPLVPGTSLVDGAPQSRLILLTPCEGPSAHHRYRQGLMEGWDSMHIVKIWRGGEGSQTTPVGVFIFPRVDQQ